MLGFKKREQKEDDGSNTNTVSAGELQFKKEIPELPGLMIPQGKLQLDPNNVMKFRVDYTPEKDSYWYPGVYKFTFEVSNEYPHKSPKVHCDTQIYHPNIDFQGNVCLNILKEDWKPTLSMATVIASVYFLFYDPNPKDPLNHEAAELMRDNRESFVANVKKTLKGGKHFGQDFVKFN